MDSTRMAEINVNEAQNAREMRNKEKENEKSKGKRLIGNKVAKSNQGVEQKKPRYNNNGGGKGFQKKP